MASGLKYVICASPLVKIYLPEWHDRLLDDPDLILDMDTKFDFVINTGFSGIRIPFNKPLVITGAKEVDVLTKFNWLIGEATGAQNETDCYGIVPFEFDPPDMEQDADLMDQLISEDAKVREKATKILVKRRTDLAAVKKKMEVELRAASEFRIKRAMRNVHNNLVRQWQINEEQKIGKYPPSVSEMFGAHVLDPEIKKASSKGAKIKANMNELMKNVAT